MGKKVAAVQKSKVDFLDQIHDLNTPMSYWDNNGNGRIRYRTNLLCANKRINSVNSFLKLNKFLYSNFNLLLFLICVRVALICSVISFGTMSHSSPLVVLSLLLATMLVVLFSNTWLLGNRGGQFLFSILVSSSLLGGWIFYFSLLVSSSVLSSPWLGLLADVIQIILLITFILSSLLWSWFSKWAACPANSPYFGVWRDRLSVVGDSPLLYLCCVTIVIIFTELA